MYVPNNTGSHRIVQELMESELMLIASQSNIVIDVELWDPGDHNQESITTIASCLTDLFPILYTNMETTSKPHMHRHF